MKALMQIVLILCVLVGAVRARLVEKSIITNGANALCCDGSRAVYYMEEFDQSDGWVIFFEGGGGCSTIEECNMRYNNTNTRILMSSDDLPRSIEGRDLLSTSSSDNPLFHNYSHVLVPYCSQDAFLANSPSPPSSVELGDPQNNSFVFRGRVIFQSIIEDLLPMLENSSHLVMGGSSAGGVGIMNNLQWLQSRLNSISSGPPELAIIIDSSWFIPFNGYHAINFSLEATQFLNIESPACMDHTLGFPCCTSLACLLNSEGYKSQPLPPMFVISSLYDIFTLKESLTGTSVDQLDFASSSNFNDQDILRIFNAYGAVINSSLLESFKTNNLTMFSPSCTQHVYLATSSLWDDMGILNRTVNSSFSASVFVLTNPVQSGQLDSTVIKSSNNTRTSLHQAMQDWYRDPYTPVFHTDTCTGPVCGECPSGIDLQPSLNLWHRVANIIVLIVASLMVAVPVFIKLFLYMYMKYMLYNQKVYVYKMTQAQRNKPRFPKAICAVSVSCTGLNYHLDTIDTVKRDDSERNEQATQLPRGHYRLSALANTILPYCKPTCCRYKAPVSDSESNSRAQTAPTYFNGIRSDSGISSSIVTNMRNGSADSLEVTSMDFILENSPARRPPKSSYNKKTILRQVNMYVNPGELLAIMGPSGSGKTTLLDVVLGRRRAGHTQGHIYVNGIPLNKMREWFIMNTGYVRQLATSFYNELTVRENLLFSMNMQAPAGMTLSQKLERVEQVIRETGLQEQADLVVGSGIGLGLSGGQRKRLTIAVQLLSMPNIIFLDEPTSGLDSASSLDILKSLQVMANTGRAIVVTIHQPRSEIFHAFDKILLLCNGQVAFFGSPVKVWEFFRKALINEELEKNEGQVQDQILDHLKEKKSQEQVLSAYGKSLEPKKVKCAVLEGKDTDSVPPSTYKRHPGFWQRLVSLESRASLRQTLFTVLYLPITYVIFGIILGTTYLNTNNPVQVMSVTCLLSCSSSLFMSSIVMSLLIEPLKLFQLEHSDRISSSHELILQVYFRMSMMGTLPLAVCATIVFVLVYFQESLEVYVFVLLTFLLANQVWISVFILLTTIAPSQAHRLCPVSAAVGGFWCGFVIPKPLMPEYYRWVFYINPAFYSYSATSVTVLHGLDLDCSRDSELECFRSSGYAALSQFGLSDVNPFQQMVILMAMTIILLTLATIILELKVSAGLIVESIKDWFKKEKNSNTRVASSTDHLNEVDTPNQTPIQLRSFRKNRLQGQTKESIQKAAEEALSGEFIDQPKHQVFHNFPWERDVENEVEGIDGGDPFSPHSTTSRVSRLESDGSEDVFEPPEFITMDEEADQDERKKAAEQKWNLRRSKIESEIQRLREMNRNRVAMMRHSIASCGDDLEEQLFKEVRRDSLPRKRYLSTANQALEDDGSKGLEIESSGRNKPPFLRAASLPTTDAMYGRIAGVPTLETYEEEDGEMMGLPPKDIPHLRQSMEDMERIDYDEIPPQQLSADHASQDSTSSKWSEV